VTLFAERLNQAHRRDGFSCGEPSLDDWFLRIAGQADRRHGSARVFVLVDDEIDAGIRPIGYYALSAHSVDIEFVPKPLSTGQPPSHPIGAALIARLAVSSRFHGRRLGEARLADAVRQVGSADEHVATPILVVDALHDQAAGFYRHYGFVPFPERPLRLAVRLRDVRATFGLAQLR